MTTRFRVVAAVAALALLGTLGWSRVQPAADRDWIDLHDRAPSLSRDGDRVTIRDVRAFEWPADGGDAIPRWEDRTYAIHDVASVWYVVAPFGSDWRGPAHTFLSFGFDDGRYLAVSVEARREKGEEYSMVGGMLKRFELIYILGDERDLIASRVLYQDDPTLLYPIRTSREGAQALLRSILDRVDALDRRPEWYGTLRNNCTTAILRHADEVLENPIGWNLRVLLPGYSDVLALDHGLLDTDLPIAHARVAFRINERVRRFAAAPDFSRRIRETPDPLADTPVGAPAALQ